MGPCRRRKINCDVRRIHVGLSHTGRRVTGGLAFAYLSQIMDSHREWSVDATCVYLSPPVDSHKEWYVDVLARPLFAHVTA